MRGACARIVVALMLSGSPVVCAADVRSVVVTMDEDRFEVSGEGNSLTGLRRAAVPFKSVSEVYMAVLRPEPVAAVARLVRATPPQVIDYVVGVTEEGVLVVGQQVRTLDASGNYKIIEGVIKRAYAALEATVPWVWIVDIPLGREVELSLELRAMTPGWPVRAVAVAPSVRR